MVINSEAFINCVMDNGVLYTYDIVHDFVFENFHNKQYLNLNYRGSGSG